MCYEALLNGDATDRPLGELIREELSDALTNGAAAAVVVVAAFLGTTVPPLGIAVLGALAVVLAVVLHEAVLVAGVYALRAQAGRTTTDGSAV